MEPVAIPAGGYFAGVEEKEIDENTTTVPELYAITRCSSR
jgi:hypothetical protein